MVEGIIRIVASALEVLAGIAPGVAKAITGGQTVDEAVSAAMAMATETPVLTGPDGQWTQDLERRKADS